MAYGMGDNTSGTNNTPLGARRRIINTTDEYPTERENSENPEVNIKQTEAEMEQTEEKMEIQIKLEHGSDDEPRVKRGRSTQRGL